jgi:hypothetical protein
VLLAVAYFIPLINYGDIVTDDLCLRYGAALLGMSPDDYYRRICDLAEKVGAETRTVGEGDDEPMRLAAPVDLGSGGCGTGCG